MDLGLDINWDWSWGGGGSERVVVVRGWSCSDKDKDGFWFFLLLVVGSAKSGGDLGGDLAERQEMLNFLVGICRKGEEKKMGRFVSEEFRVQWTALVAIKD